jgi:hypothetical protein
MHKNGTHALNHVARILVISVTLYILYLASFIYVGHTQHDIAP